MNWKRGLLFIGISWLLAVIMQSIAGFGDFLPWFAIGSFTTTLIFLIRAPPSNH